MIGRDRAPVTAHLLTIENHCSAPQARAAGLTMEYLAAAYKQYAEVHWQASVVLSILISWTRIGVPIQPNLICIKPQNIRTSIVAFPYILAQHNSYMLLEKPSSFTCTRHLHILIVEHQTTQTSRGQEFVNALYLFEIMLRLCTAYPLLKGFLCMKYSHRIYGTNYNHWKAK